MVLEQWNMVSFDRRENGDCNSVDLVGIYKGICDAGRFFMDGQHLTEFSWL